MGSTPHVSSGHADTTSMYSRAHESGRAPTRARWIHALAVCVALIVVSGAAVAPARGASANTTVSVTVASATNLDVSACLAGTSNVTDLGTILPTTSSVASADCSLVFGSSNDTSVLRVSQADALGLAMFNATGGALDTSFDGDGKQGASVGAGAVADQARAIAMQADGKVVAAGYCDMGGGAGGNDFCVARFTTAGALDATFDGDGKQTTAIAPGAADDFGYGVAVQGDGKIVVAGECNMGGATGKDMCLVRYTSAGALDTTFDTDGIVTTAIGPGANADSAAAITLQADGKIVVTGECNMAGTGFDLCVVRYTTVGALDTSFDTDGVQTIAVGAGAAVDWAKGLAVQSDGKIVTVGYCDMAGATGYDMCAARLTSAGALDTAFDGDGKQTINIGAGTNVDSATSVLVQSDGKVVVAGKCDMGATGQDICASRLTSGGALDATFDVDGKVSTAVGPGASYDSAYGAVLQPDGKLVTTGECDTGGATAWDFCMVRYTTAGALDTTFDTDGVLTTWIAAGAAGDSGFGIAVGSDGKLYAAGQCWLGATGNDICVAAYAPFGTFSNYANAVTDWDTAPSTNMFGACLRSVSGGAAGQWAVDGNATCTAFDTDPWNAIPAAATKIAYASSAGTVAATANLRFGIRSSSSQPPGAYLAPITFDVAAPNV